MGVQSSLLRSISEPSRGAPGKALISDFCSEKSLFRWSAIPRKRIRFRD